MTYTELTDRLVAAVSRELHIAGIQHVQKETRVSIEVPPNTINDWPEAEPYTVGGKPSMWFDLIIYPDKRNPRLVISQLREEPK